MTDSKIIFTLLISLLFRFAIVSAQGPIYTIDARHSVIGFSVKILGGLSEVDGHFTKFSGEIILNENDFTQSSIKAEIEAKSISTGVSPRDQHLREEDFFYVEKYPLIRFTSNSIQKTKGAYLARGKIHIRGVTREVSISFAPTSDNLVTWVFGRPWIIFEGTARINRKDFGIQANARWNRLVAATGELAMSDEVEIRLKIMALGKQIYQMLLEAEKQSGMKGALEEYKKLKEQFKDVDAITELTFNQFGYNLIDMGKVKSAIQAFQLWTTEFPQSANAYDSLGEAYLANGEQNKARIAYKKSLELDPDNHNAKEVLNKLKN